MNASTSSGQTSATAMQRPVIEVSVYWIDAALMQRLAIARGYLDDSSASWLDYVETDECEKSRGGFSSVTKAKAWAARNRGLDLWSQPEIACHEWPNARRLSYERTTTRRLRYVGDGYGWEELEVAS